MKFVYFNIYKHTFVLDKRKSQKYQLDHIDHSDIFWDLVLNTNTEVEVTFEHPV